MREWINDEWIELLPLFILLLIGIALLLPAFGLAGCTNGGTKMDNPPPISGQKPGGADDSIVNQEGRIMVYIRMSDLSTDKLNELKARGAVLTHIAESYKTVTAFIHPERLDDIRTSPGVLNVRKATKPITNPPAIGKEIK